MRNTGKDLLVHVAQHLGLEVGEDDVPGRLPLLVPGVIVPVEHQDGLRKLGFTIISYHVIECALNMISRPILIGAGAEISEQFSLPLFYSGNRVNGEIPRFTELLNTCLLLSLQRKIIRSMSSFSRSKLSDLKGLLKQNNSI